jgi:hypothetical protein
MARPGGVQERHESSPVVAIYETHTEAEAAVNAVGAAKFVVTAHGTSAEVGDARAILAARGTPDVATYPSPGK